MRASRASARFLRRVAPCCSPKGRKCSADAVQRNVSPPHVSTAASADWQINGEPIFYDGNYYDASGPTIFFDGAVMSRTGVWKGVPLYQDRTLEPYSVVLRADWRQS